MATAAQDALRTGRLRRFTLRTVFVFVSIACLACGREANRLHRRSRAVALLNDWGQWVIGQPGQTDGFPWGLLPQSARDWLSHARRRCTAVDAYPITLCGLSPPDPAVRSSHKLAKPTLVERKQLVAAIATLTELELVQVSFELDDDDLRVLSSLNDLEIITFNTRGITKSGIAHIQRLRKLEMLCLQFDGPDCVSVDTIMSLNEPRSRKLITINGPMRLEDVARVNAALPGVVEINLPGR